MVRSAVRKFAQNAPMADKRPDPAQQEIPQHHPAGHFAASAASAASPPPVPVANLLNRAAFNNMHMHVEDERIIDQNKVVRVVLNRIEPTLPQDSRISSTSAGPTNSGNEIKKKQPKKIIRRHESSTADSIVIRDMTTMKLRNRKILRPWDFSDQVKAQKRAERRLAQIVSADGGKTMFRESVDDNRPLAYFLEKARRTSRRNAETKKIKPAASKKPTIKTAVATKKANTRTMNDDGGAAGMRMLKGQRRASDSSTRSESDFTGFPPWNVVSPSSSSFELVYDEEDSDVEIMPLTRTARISSETTLIIGNSGPPETPNAATEDFPFANTSCSSEVGRLLPIQTQVDSLSDFIIDLFNCEDKWRLERDNESRGNLHSKVLDIVEEDFNNPENGGNLIVTRVNEWLQTFPTGHAESSKTQKNDSGTRINDAEFKVPGTPPWRHNSSNMPVSSRSVNRSTLAPRDLALTKHCTAWSYEKMSNIEFQRELIKEFCGECTRCKLMFRPVRPESRNASPPGIVSDVYDFNTERDQMDINPIAPYRGARSEENISTSRSHENRTNTEKNSMFVRISNHHAYFKLFKHFLTDSGKKIHQAAIIIRNKLNEGLAISSLDQNTLGHAIGLLMTTHSGVKVEDNARRLSTISDDIIEDNSQLAVAPTSIESVNLSRPIESAHASSNGVPDEIPRRPRPSFDLVERNATTSVQESHKFSASEEDFTQSPVKFTTRVLQKCPKLGLCGIIPPQSFKPVCDIDDTKSSFKVSNLYINRMFQRWSPLTRELSIIKSLQDPKTNQSPLFAGLELDLVKLYEAVQEQNGIEAVNSDIENWEIVKQKMGLYYGNKIKTKLQNIYFKYLLSYSALSADERCVKDEEIDACWNARQRLVMERSHNPLYRQARMRKGSPCDVERQSRMELACAEAEDCVTNGRSCDLKTFQKLAQQVQNTYFTENSNPSTEEVELEFWDVVLSASSHVCVHAASVDTAEHGYGFPADRNSFYGDHPWNLKRLGVSSWNLLSYLGPTPGVSSTSLQYGMTFSASCWHMDPTKVPYIEYLHEGPPKIWYSISGDQGDMFRNAAESQCPFSVLNKSIWLPCDMMLIPPPILSQYGVRVTRHVQHAGTYVVVYPNTYCASISTGYTVSEGAYFAPHSWINNVESIYLTLRNNCEPSLFAMEKLLIAMAENEDTAYSLLQRVHPVLMAHLRGEQSYRQRLASWNVELLTPEMSPPQAFQYQNRRTSWAAWQIQETGECAYCRCHIVLSRVIGVTEGQTSVCAMHGVHLYEQMIMRNQRPSNVYCILILSNERINAIIDNIRIRIRRCAALVPEARAVERVLPGRARDMFFSMP